MTNSTNQPSELAITVPLSTANRGQAEAFAQHQSSSAKQDRVYRNTLAVSAVNYYLQLQQFSTDLESCNSWSIPNQFCEDAADLMVVGLGKVECRPIASLDEPLSLPPEVWLDRIGYIAVHLNADFTEATLLGFITAFNPDELDPDNPIKTISLSELQSLDDLMDYFERLELGQPIVEQLLSTPEYAPLVEADPYARLMLVAQLERIYRCDPPRKWRVKGENVLSEGSHLAAAIRKGDTSGGGISVDRLKIQDLAEELLERLADVWRQGEVQQ